MSHFVKNDKLISSNRLLILPEDSDNQKNQRKQKIRNQKSEIRNQTELTEKQTNFLLKKIEKIVDSHHQMLNP